MCRRFIVQGFPAISLWVSYFLRLYSGCEAAFTDQRNYFQENDTTDAVIPSIKITLMPHKSWQNFIYEGIKVSFC